MGEDMNKKIALTLRLPIELYERAKIISQKEKKSFSGYIRELLEKKVKEEEKKALFDAFSLVAEDMDDVDVAYAFEAQREVVLKNE
jgi:predicted CopG family antitoxin